VYVNRTGSDRVSQSIQSFFTFGSFHAGNCFTAVLYSLNAVSLLFSGSLNECVAQHRKRTGLPLGVRGKRGKGPPQLPPPQRSVARRTVHNNWVSSAAPSVPLICVRAMCCCSPVVWYIGRLRVYKSVTWNRASKLDELLSAPILHTLTTLHPTSSFLFLLLSCFVFV
jgi:hypothetical protein